MIIAITISSPPPAAAAAAAAAAALPSHTNTPVPTLINCDNESNPLVVRRLGFFRLERGLSPRDTFYI
jgi:hypothetical protein